MGQVPLIKINQLIQLAGGPFFSRVFVSDTWEHGRTSSSERSAEAEQRLQQQEMRELRRWERLPLYERLEKQEQFQGKCKKQLDKIEEKLKDLKGRLEELIYHQLNENNLSQLYSAFKDQDLDGWKQIQVIDDKEKDLIWVEKIKIVQGDKQMDPNLFCQVEAARLGLLELQEVFQKRQLEKMEKQLNKVEKQLNNIEQNGYHQALEPSQERMKQFITVYQDKKNIVQQLSNKIKILEEAGKELNRQKDMINNSIRSQAAETGGYMPNIQINRLEEHNTQIDHRELSLEQGIQLLSEMTLKIDGAEKLAQAKYYSILNRLKVKRLVNWQSRIFG